MRSISPLLVEEKIALCAALYRSGLSTRDIAAKTGIGKSSVPAYLRMAGVEMNGPALISKKMTGKPGSRLGVIVTEETRRRMSQSALGNKRCLNRVVSKASIEKNRASNKMAHPKKAKPEPAPFIGPRKPCGTWVHPDEKAIRDHVRSAAKRMLRRVLTMARVRKDLPTERLLGYTQSELRIHLESGFAEGMSWHDRSSFHIDHIVPVAHFFRNGIYDPAVINALSNLQPLTPQENRVKSDRVLTITDAGAAVGIVRLA